jgi:hypothetical protein
LVWTQASACWRRRVRTLGHLPYSAGLGHDG